MKTAVRLGPIAHLRRAKYIGNISNNQAWEWGGDKLPLTLIPGYHISPLTGWGWRMKFPGKIIKSHAEKMRFLNTLPNGVRLARNASWYFIQISCKKMADFEHPTR